MAPPDSVHRFQAARPMLLGLAYRILGSRADAEDAVQDTFLKWQANERDDILNADAWLTTACTRHCLDLLKAGDRARVDYMGTWLPEPVRTVDASEEHDASGLATLASSLTTAFLLALQRLTPKERAAYLLHEIFERPYPEVAATLDMKEPACRQLVIRARQHIASERVRHDTPPARQQRLLHAFRDAIATGSTAALASLLSDDVRLSSDGGGKVTAAKRVMRGQGEVLRFIEAGLHVWLSGCTLEEVQLNGAPGFILREGQDIHGTVAFSWNADGQLQDFYIMRNPDKLLRIDAAPVH